MVAAKARGGLDEATFNRFRERLHYFRERSQRGDYLPRFGGAARAARELSRQRRILYVDSPGRVRSGYRESVRGRLAGRNCWVAPGSHRKTFWLRPAKRQEPPGGAEPSLERGADLPHRSLPGKGHRAKRAGISFCQRDHGADLESPLYQSRADHPCRDGRGWL